MVCADKMFPFQIHFICYWGLVLLYDTKYNVDAIRDSLKNQFFLTLPLSCLFFWTYPVEYERILLSVAMLPLVVVLSDMYFYCVHRVFHSVFWAYHRRHHSGTVQIAKSLDADMIEHLVANLGSFVVPFLLLPTFNTYVLHLWVAISTINTCISHAEKRMWGDKGVHHNHHARRNCNYGTGFYILDRLFGSYYGVAPEVSCPKNGRVASEGRRGAEGDS
jgi:sterol desaturase/sphingolipid hydroxylase (fatty acid hydroxylase superfamily)